MTAADWLRVLTTILSACVGAWIAANIALNPWRVEMTGKRRAELAEEVRVGLFARLASRRGHVNNDCAAVNGRETFL